MKSLTVFLFPVFLLVSMATQGWSQAKIWSANISLTNIDVRGGPVVLSQLNVDIPAGGGRVLVQFDGSAYPDVGDRLVLAASNDGGWHPNDGATDVEAINSDLNERSFSHSRRYYVAGGVNAFYAVAQNYVEEDGNGMASIYGTLTVKFFPGEPGTPLVEFAPISRTNINLRGAPVIVGQVDVDASHYGQVIVRFDGKCVATPGDLIVLAASDDGDWHINDGNVGVEVLDGDINSAPFCHTGVYSVSPGIHTFYAVAENYVEEGGSGVASIYGSLSAEYYPSISGQPIAVRQGVSETNINLRGSAVVVGHQSISASGPGSVWVHFDGDCYASVGDRILLAASDDGDWHVNDGNVAVEAYDADLNHQCFSHARVYDVGSGTHDFYAVAENYVEIAGSGIGSIYGNVSAVYFPDDITAVEEPGETTVLPRSLRLAQNYPNPFNPSTTISFDLPVRSGEDPLVRLTVYDIRGRRVRALIDSRLAPGTHNIHWDGSDDRGRTVSSGVYVYTLSAGDETATRRMMVLK